MKKFILLALMVLCQVLGDIWLSRGMKQFGEVTFATFADPSALLSLIVYFLTSPWISLGIIFLIACLFFYLAAISRFDLSYVLSINAFSYVLNAIFAWLLLDERISGIRWASTSLISSGVLLVGLSESVSVDRTIIKKFKIKIGNIFFFLLPFSISICKTWLGVIVLAFADSAGDVSLAMGMRRIGKFELFPIKKTIRQVYQILTNPSIILGVFCQATAFFSFISLLSWADISFVRPATALTYVFSLLASKYILHEKIRLGRLIGIILIAIGIFIHR
jgi:drug/metabolite transporter (DMT)-like permease